MNVILYQPKYSSSALKSIEMIQNDYSLTAKPSIDVLFYFNFALRGMKAAAWVAVPQCSLAWKI